MSTISLKPLHEQVIVITGASSGIGLATASLAAEQGARVVLAARSRNVCAEIVGHLQARNRRAMFVSCDVSSRSEVEDLARATVNIFGTIDTWVNNAGVSIYGKLEEVSEEDSRQLFETNFWGVYYGSLVALPYLRKTGGALINVGSEVSETVVPLQGMYSASKHAVKGFTDALRVEVMDVDAAPVSITLVQPTATNTPFPQHARNYLRHEPKLPSPLDDPEDVARAILKAAVHPTRDVKVGLMSKVNVAVSRLAPQLADKLAAKQADRQERQEAPRDPQGTLRVAGEVISTSGRIHGLPEE